MASGDFDLGIRLRKAIADGAVDQKKIQAVVRDLSESDEMLYRPLLHLMSPNNINKLINSQGSFAYSIAARDSILSGMSELYQSSAIARLRSVLNGFLGQDDSSCPINLQENNAVKSAGSESLAQAEDAASHQSAQSFCPFESLEIFTKPQNVSAEDAATTGTEILTPYHFLDVNASRNQRKRFRLDSVIFSRSSLILRAKSPKDAPETPRTFGIGISSVLGWSGDSGKIRMHFVDSGSFIALLKPATGTNELPCIIEQFGNCGIGFIKRRREDHESYFDGDTSCDVTLPTPGHSAIIARVGVNARLDSVSFNSFWLTLFVTCWPENRHASTCPQEADLSRIAGWAGDNKRINIFLDDSTPIYALLGPPPGGEHVNRLPDIIDLLNAYGVKHLASGADWHLAEPSTVRALPYKTKFSSKPVKPATAKGKALKKIGNDTPGGNCFIATAIYGSPNHPELSILRDYRDNVLMSCRQGRLFIRWYYRVAPYIANALVCTGVAPRLRPVLSLAIRHVLLKS